MNTQDIIQEIKNGQVAVIPTDTLYGIVGLAQNKDTVEKIYWLKHRQPDKPCIILISSLTDLELFHVDPSDDINASLMEYWPGPVSIILPCPSPEFDYLHRGTFSLAFRWPNHPQLLDILNQTGPLIAPSANPEGQPPAINIEMAQQYFGNEVAYLDGGELANRPSKLIQILGGEVHTLRP